MDEEKLQQLVTEVAKRELREDEGTRRQALEQFRDWIEKNPDIRDCRTDERYLLWFLRKGKFSIPMTQEVFLRYANFCETYSHFVRNNNISDPKLNHFLKNGFIYLSPVRTAEGRAVVICHYSRFEPDKHVYTEYLRAIYTTYHAMTGDADQVLGSVAIIESAGITPAQVAHVPIGELIAMMKATQKTIPHRFKGIHFVNMSSVVKWVFDLFVSSLSPKMAARLFAHSTMEDLYKHVGRRVLPKELGGDMPEAEMIASWNTVLESKREELLLNDKLRVVNQQDLKTSMAELPGSFRTLRVD